LKIAIDIGIETPDFIPCVPTFKNILKDKYKSASDTFNKAISNIEDNPDLAIGLANSTLESIIKEIIQDGHMTIVYDEKLTLYKLTESILKGFNMFPKNTIPKEIKNIGSSLLNICQNIECLRSSQTSLHGKSNSDYIIDESLYAYFVVNSVSTVGLFIHSFYKTKFLVEINKPVELSEGTDLPF